MSSNEIVPLSEEELLRFLLSMGSPPVLSTEDPKAFEDLFLNIARPLKNSDRLSLYIAWEIAVDTWSNARYARHETIAVSRWWSKFHESQVVAAKTSKATYEEGLRKRAAALSTYSADAAKAAELQEKIEAMSDEPAPINNEVLDRARKEIEACQRDEHETFKAAAPDLVRLDRYECRACSRQKRAVEEFMMIKVKGARRIPAAEKGAVSETRVPAA